MTIRVAVATEDGKKVKDGDFNKAKFFAIYDVSGMSPTKVELRLNTRRMSDNPASPLEILKDCEVIISKQFRKEVKEVIESMGVITHETKHDDVISAVTEFAEMISKLKK